MINHLKNIQIIMTQNEIINKVEEYCTDFATLVDDIKKFSESLEEYGKELPLYSRENIRYIVDDVENISKHLRRAKSRLSFDISEIRDLDNMLTT